MRRSYRGFAERRRRRLNFQVAEQLDSRSTVTPIGAAELGFGALGVPSKHGSMHANRGVLTAA